MSTPWPLPEQHSEGQAAADLAAHTGNTSNPHSTTAGQVGADPAGSAAAVAADLAALDVVAIKEGDTRLADARTALESTVSQAEAEAGTATTRRIWTAQRVGQAITAIGALLFAPLSHKSRHVIGGPDALTPGDIGAASTAQVRRPYRFGTNTAKARPLLPSGAAWPGYIEWIGTGTPANSINGDTHISANLGEE